MRMPGAVVCLGNIAMGRVEEEARHQAYRSDIACLMDLPQSATWLCKRWCKGRSVDICS